MDQNPRATVARPAPACLDLRQCRGDRAQRRTAQSNPMPVQQLLEGGQVPVKAWTPDLVEVVHTLKQVVCVKG